MANRSAHHSEGKRMQRALLGCKEKKTSTPQAGLDVKRQTRAGAQPRGKPRKLEQVLSSPSVTTAKKKQCCNLENPTDVLLQKGLHFQQGNLSCRNKMPT